MLGFGALGELPLASFEEDRPATWLSLPVVTIAFAPYGAGVQAGRHLALPAFDIAANVPPAAVAVGKSFGLPALDLAFIGPPVGFFGGRNVTLPAPDIAFDLAPIGLRAGKNIDLTAPVMAVSMPPIGIQPGKLISLPALDVVWGALALVPSPGKSFGLPALDIVLRYGTFRVETGRIFNLANTVYVTSDVGCLGEGALGEFAIGEGEPLAQEFTEPVRLRFSLFAAGLQAGRNLDLTAPDISFNAPVPEVSARHRKLRVLAITS